MAIPRFFRMPEAPPSLVGAVAAVLERAFAAAADRWVRADLPFDWPMADVARALELGGRPLRVGVLRSAVGTELEEFASSSSDVPSEITAWRNEPLVARQSVTTLVLGDARGDEEAGLRQFGERVSTEDVFREWQSRLEQWFVENRLPLEYQRVLAKLFDHLITGEIDAPSLDNYAAAALADPANARDRMRDEAWRLGLLRDKRLLDPNETTDLVGENIEVRQLLVSPSDSASDLAQLGKLKQAADRGNATAVAALAFRETLDPELLKGVELSEIRSLLQSKGTKKSKQTSPRTLDLEDFLNQAEGAEAGTIEAVLSELAGTWKLEPDPGQELEQQELETLFVTEDGTTYKVKQRVRPASWHPDDLAHIDQAEVDAWGDNDAGETSPGVDVAQDPSRTDPKGSDLGPEESTEATAEPKDQVLAMQVPETAERVWRPTVGNVLTGHDLLERAQLQDGATPGSTALVPLVESYLEAREAIRRYGPWLANSGVTLLLVDADAREAVREFIDAWLSLVREVAERAVDDSELIRSTVETLEGVWGLSEGAPTPHWAVLSPFHPYWLDPLVRLADYAAAALGAPKLGDRLGWAYDRALPAYRALWAGPTTLLHSNSTGELLFEEAPSGDRPTVSSGDGVARIGRAFLGYHGFAVARLVIVLLNPPAGPALLKSLRTLNTACRGQLRVYTATTTDTATSFDVDDLDVRNLGRFDSVADWMATASVRAHIVFYFGERSAGSAAAGAGGGGPTKGSHIALKVRLRPTAAFGGTANLVPYVTFEPREENAVVLAIRRLASPGGASPRLFEMQPMLEEEQRLELVALSELADWLVVGAPGPLGLVAPQELGEDMPYIGRESLGEYGLYAYATELFPIRKYVTARFHRDTPVVVDAGAAEGRLTELAKETPNGILAVGREGHGKKPGFAMWEHVGLMVAASEARRGD